MKSSTKDLEKRGFLEVGAEKKYENIDFSDLCKLLESKISVDRTLGARLLGLSKKTDAIEFLINALKKEKALYSKIEISNSLVLFGESALDSLIDVIGEIGNNQHSDVSEKKFNKKSYPLPRDIVSRVIIRIGKPAIPKLVQLLETDNIKILSEVIDAIGFINFYNRDLNSVYEKLLNCYESNKNIDLIRWKIIRSFCGFSESLNFLKNLEKNEKNENILNEIKRGIYLITQIDAKY